MWKISRECIAEIKWGILEFLHEVTVTVLVVFVFGD
jgi:hypothetical protein